MPQPISHKVWFITGASKGFGYVWTEAALARGDRVAAAARNIGSLDALKAKNGDRLLPLALDVGNKAAVDAAMSRSITPATACSAPSKRSASKRPARRSKPTCSALCG
jgi:NADP-dependent 3-hydroxy acid dehydrogenase YdfG